MDTCFISQKPILSLPGEVDKMDPYVLEFNNPEDDRAISENAVGYCYSRHLTGSDWAAFWGDRRRAHFGRNLSLELVIDSEEFTIWENPNRHAFTLLYLNGVAVELPDMQTLEDAPRVDGFRMISRRREMNIHQMPEPVAKEVMDRLAESGEYSLRDLAEKLDILDCYLHPELLADSKLILDDELKMYWTSDSLSALCNYQIAIPEAAVAALKDYHSN